MMAAPHLDPHTLRSVAVAAGVDPRTVDAFLEGRPMRSTTAGRVASALRAAGLDVAQSHNDDGIAHRGAA